MRIGAAMAGGIVLAVSVLAVTVLAAGIVGADDDGWIVRPRSAICPSPVALREARAAAEIRDVDLFRETGCIIADGSQHVRGITDGNRNEPNAALRARIVAGNKAITAYVWGQNVVRRKPDGRWIMLPCERVGGWLCDPTYTDDLP